MSGTLEPERLGGERIRTGAPAPRRIVGGTIVAAVGAFGLFTRPGDSGEYDHFAPYLVLRHMDRGMGFCPAFAAGYRDLGTQLGSARAFRTPPVFVVWHTLPGTDWLFPLFLASVALSGLLLMRLAIRPWVALPAVAFLLFTGRKPWGPFSEGWLVAELWVVPLVAGTLVAWRRDRRLLAASLALVAAGSREPAAMLILGGVMATLADPARRAARYLAPWLAATLIAAAAFALHLHIAGGYTSVAGNDAALLGTANLPFSVTGMMQPLPIGIVLWALALLRVRREPLDLLPAVPLMLLPLAGFIVERDYWGILFVPLAIVWGLDEVCDRWPRRGQRTFAATADSSPLTNLPESSVE